MTNQQRIETLEKMRNKIAAEYNALKNSSNKIYDHHLDELKNIKEAKEDEVNKWEENELIVAERIAEGEKYQNESDLENKKVEIKTRIGDYIAFKQKILNEKFPEAAEYFRQQGYKSLIHFSYQSDPPQFRPPVEVDTNDEPLFSQKEIEEDLNILRATNYQSVHRVLRSLQTNDSAVLTVKGMPPIHGTIGQIFDDMFEFKYGNSKVMTITFQSITYGQSTIEPES